ncbi:MAG: hypothetical protein ACRDJH_23545 [Thermomicrobiales bacterium]
MTIRRVIAAPATAVRAARPDAEIDSTPEPSAAVEQAAAISRIADGERQVTVPRGYQTVLELQRTVGNAAVQHLLAAPAAKSLIQRTPGETDEQRLQRQAATTIGLLSRKVAQADEKGWDGITLVIAHTGREIEPRGMEKHGPRKPRASGIIVKSASSIAKDHLEPALEWLMMGGPSEAVIEFKRDARGIMQSKKWERRALPPVAKGGTYRPKTEREILDEHGIPNPKKIWTEIGEKWEEEVKDAGKMVLTFGLTEVATWIVGGGLLKVLGVGLGRLRHLYRLIKGRKTKAVAEGLAKLGKGEADELGQLLNRVNRGERLNPAETKRLEELAGRLDDALAPGAKAGQQAAGKTTPGGATSSKSPSTKFDDEPTVPDARKPLAGQPRLVNRGTPTATASATQPIPSSLPRPISKPAASSALC